MKELGNIIKINVYAELKENKKSELTLKTIEEIILKYKSWLEITDSEDKIESYEKFLRAQ